MHQNVQTLPNGIRIRIPKSPDGETSVAPLNSSTLIRRLSSYNAAFPSSSSSAKGAENDDHWIQVTCRKCSDFGPEANARAFVMGPSPLSIVVCQNRIRPAAASTLSSMQEMDEIVTHELIHIYDVRWLKLNLLQCADLAYSEIRAARAAECASYHPSRNSHASLAATSPAAQKQPPPQPFADCVRTRATTATQNLFHRQAPRCIQQVFAQAMADDRPHAASNEDKSSSTTSFQRRRNSQT